MSRGSCTLAQLMWMHDALPSPPYPQPTSFLLSSTPWIMKPSKYTVQLRVPQAGDRDVTNWLQLCPDLQTVCQKTWVMSGVMWRGSNARNLTVSSLPGVYHCGEVDRWHGACHENSCSAAEEPWHRPHNQESNLLNLWSCPPEKLTLLWSVSCKMNHTHLTVVNITCYTC